MRLRPKKYQTSIDYLNRRYNDFFRGDNYLNGRECWVHDANVGMFSLYWETIEAYDPTEPDERFHKVITQHDIKFGSYLQFPIPYVFKPR
jgi:hypothetical protein